MGTIDFSFMNGNLGDLNLFFTNLAKKEQMQESDDPTEDVSSTVVSVSFSDGAVALSLNTNKNNDTSVWINNFYTMARTILPDKIRESIELFKGEIISQLMPELIAGIGGALA